MKKRIIASNLLLVLLVVMLSSVAFAMAGDGPGEITTTSEAYIPSETSTAEVVENKRIISRSAERMPEQKENIKIILDTSVHERITTNNVDELQSLMNDCASRMESATQIADAGHNLGYPEEHPIFELASKEYTNAEEDLQFYKEQYEAVKWEVKSNEYPAATATWLYLKDQGYNDYVCAGIIGNMMAEVGGQTLNFDVYAKGHGYYGICQWKQASYPNVVDKPLEDQLAFLRDTIEYEIDSFGYVYRSNFKYENFIQLQNEQDVALAFAKSYERCGSDYYQIRKENASKALEYFTN